jgi:hypothetical protein
MCQSLKIVKLEYQPKRIGQAVSVKTNSLMIEGQINRVRLESQPYIQPLIPYIIRFLILCRASYVGSYQ